MLPLDAGQPQVALTVTQQETVDALKRSRFGFLEVGPQLVQPRTADVLVKKGLCEYDTVKEGAKAYRILRLAGARECKTPCCMFQIQISDNSIGVTVKLPRPINLSKEQASALEIGLHDAVEGVLAPLFEGD